MTTANGAAHLNGQTPPKPKPEPAPPRTPRTQAKPEPAVAIEGNALIVKAVAGIGATVQAMLPRRASAKEHAAAQYWGASVTQQLAEAWRGRAKEQATALGVLPDYVAHPYQVGTSGTVYEGTMVTIGMKVVEQADRVNVPGLVADLLAAGVKPAVLKRLVRRNTKQFHGAHIFTASLR
jgi:hypothetical protein